MWNQLEETIKCLESTQSLDYPNSHVLLVDNGSTDNSRIIAHQCFPDTSVLDNGRNLGYAGGNNTGMRLCIERKYDYILVLNNDTVLDSSSLALMVDDLEEHKNAAAAAPKIFFYDSPSTIYYAGGLASGVWHTVHRGYGDEDRCEYNEGGETEWLTGCAILFRRTALESVGLFEPRFFVLCEDADWSFRATRAGYKLRYVPRARIWHKGSRSFGAQSTPTYMYYYSRNKLLWIERNFPWRQKRWIYRLALRESFTHPILREPALSPKERGKLRRAIWQGIFDYGARRFGQRRLWF